MASICLTTSVLIGSGGFVCFCFASLYAFGSPSMRRASRKAGQSVVSEGRRCDGASKRALIAALAGTVAGAATSPAPAPPSSSAPPAGARACILTFPNVAANAFPASASSSSSRAPAVLFGARPWDDWDRRVMHAWSPLATQSASSAGLNPSSAGPAPALLPLALRGCKSHPERRRRSGPPNKSACAPPSALRARWCCFLLGCGGFWSSASPSPLVASACSSPSRVSTANASLRPLAASARHER
mmetsp:Transcript_25065/g.82128  ORF Transcript_25065/g.82128 Transcript_25065/m.82128 type:complete len:244 (+) Transcript_25065:2866-3597(+)